MKSSTSNTFEVLNASGFNFLRYPLEKHDDAA